MNARMSYWTRTLTLGAILTTSILVADAAKQKTTFSSFIQKLQKEGDDNFIRPNVAPMLELPPGAPCKAYIVDTLAREADHQPEKIYNLVFEPAGSTAKSIPKNVVMIDGYTRAESSIGYYYKVGLDGKLLSVLRLSGKIRDGKGVKGSGVKEALDINSPDVQARFKKELDFWLSGKFRKHWKPKAGAKTSQN